ncbi:condensin-2 complex subunit H2 isoform X1 [Monodelphis domestica]|uniref:condensin-2 complex subunit H2 isoform X1 n=1 Tax=Monodelphis domestica TaxID=13616 RepID=UPI0024E21D44|nr:condensin-2 complex subunit H2 isoform X1 [Monodelphis domestica]
MEDVESRFAHLLQPIRDLTKNWEVDVAAQLGEYLEELDQICISFDEGKTTMNFIEAALLIQGSACVYSKKVEYLYSLVYQALDFISGKKRNKQPTSVQPDGHDEDASCGAHPEPEEEFLSLDDLADPRANIDLKNDQTPNAVLVIPLVPMALVPPDEEEKKNSPLYSRQGEILASRKDFRMNTSTPHPSGAFMLEPGGLSPMEQMLPRTQPDAERPEEMPMDVSVCMSPAPVLNFSQDDDEKPEEALPEGEDDDVGGDLLIEVPEVPAVSPKPPEPGIQQQGIPKPKRYTLRGRATAAIPHPSWYQKESRNLWQNLDPFDSLEGKPFKKGSPYSLPQHLEETSSGKRKRKTSTRLQGFHEWYLATYSGGENSQKPQPKGPTFADMEALYWKHLKKQMDTLRKLRRGEVTEQQLSKVQERLQALEEERVEESLEHLGGGDSFLELEDVEPMEEAPEPEIIPPLSYEELVQRNVELFIASSQKYVHETELSQRIRDWEDTIGPLLQEQEEHVPFDIHNYGDQVVASFRQLNEWCPFAELVAGKPAFEVCRSMLASLQLANDYTVEIAQKPGLEEAVDTMSLRLLSRQRAHERFQTYTAPSMALP